MIEVSIVMCTYNGEKYIVEQLQSIINQTHPIAEIVVVDDCSTDNTLNLLLEFKQTTHISMNVVCNECNLGYNQNFEKALNLAKYNIIAISDQDDIWHSQKIEKMLQCWNEKTLLIYCNSVEFKDQIPLDFKANKHKRRLFGNNPKQLSVFNTVSGHNIIIKRELLDVAKRIPTEVYYDWWLALAAMCNGGISYLDEVLVFQRIHQNNASINKANLHTNFNNKLLLTKQLKYFNELSGMKEDQKIFFENFSRLWYKSLNKRFSVSLMLFFLINSKHIFAYKRKNFPYFSYIKHSILFSFHNKNEKHFCNL